VVEFDIKAAFDQIDHGLLLKAVRSHIKERWILLYLERWLTAPFETPGGEQVPRQRGTAAGRGVFTDSDESVHALYVRPLDAAKVSAMPVLSLCR
jgi:hypothetical protein